MRFCWPVDATSIRRTALESALLAAGGLVMASLMTQRSYEAAVTIEEPAIARTGAARLVEAARSLSQQDPHGQPVRLGSVVLGQHRVRVLCRSEDARRAREACSYITSEATRVPSARVDVTSSPVQAPTHAVELSVAAFALGVSWLAFRLIWRRTRLRAQQLDELHAWSVARPDEAEVDSAVPGPGKVSSRRLKARRATLPGMTPIVPAIAPEGTEPEQGVPGVGEVTNGGLRTKVVYRVGANPFRPDKSVLTPDTLAQLSEQCELMLAEETCLQVIRVASDVGSRYAKTQTAAQLAYMLASRGDAPVLLLEADSDAPALHKVLRIEAPAGIGFSEQLQRLHGHGQSGTLSVVRVEGNLHVLIESRVSALVAFGQELFAEVLAELRRHYRHIVVDGPVIDVWPDVEHLAHCTDALVMVTGQHTPASTWTNRYSSAA